MSAFASRIISTRQDSRVLFRFLIIAKFLAQITFHCEPFVLLSGWFKVDMNDYLQIYRRVNILFPSIAARRSKLKAGVLMFDTNIGPVCLTRI